MSNPPRIDTIDRSQPEKYLSLDQSFVGSGPLKAIASGLTVTDPHESLGRVWRWLRDNLVCKNDPSEYGWRTANDVLARRRYIGCADHALIFGCLARACGVPTVWVKSLEVAWIRQFRQSGKFDGGNGHVFLEVFLDGGWRLLDATQDRLYEDYISEHRLLPGQQSASRRYAYDKGGDPRELVLSLDWTPWVEETKSIFGRFDLDDLDLAKDAVRGIGRRLAV